MKYTILVMILIVALLMTACFENEPKKVYVRAQVDTVIITDTLIDTVTITKTVNIGDYHDIYVVSQGIIKTQLTGELLLFSDYKHFSIEKTADDKYKVNMIVLWHNGETQLQSEVAMNLRYFGGDMKNPDNWVMTWFGQVPRCFYRATCGS